MCSRNLKTVITYEYQEYLEESPPASQVVKVLETGVTQPGRQIYQGVQKSVIGASCPSRWTPSLPSPGYHQLPCRVCILLCILRSGCLLSLSGSKYLAYCCTTSRIVTALQTIFSRAIKCQIPYCTYILFQKKRNTS